MSEGNETHAEVIAEMRKMPNDIIVDANANFVFCRFADRAEAAHKREIDKLNSVIQAQRSQFDAEMDRLRREKIETAARAAMQAVNLTNEKWKRETGNAAKLREAAVEISEIVQRIIFLYGDFPVELHDIHRKANAALAEPARNCDFHNTEHEARRAWFIEEVQPRLDGKRMDHKELPFSDWIFEKAKKGGAE